MQIIYNPNNGKKYLISGNYAYKIDTMGVYELILNQWIPAKELI
jgi:hypothetical protein